MSKRKELIIKSYIYLLGGIALLSGVIAIFKGEYPFILETKPFVVWCVMLSIGVLFELKGTYDCFREAANGKELDTHKQLSKKMMKSFLLRLMILTCFVGGMSFNFFDCKVVILFFIFIPIILNESIRECINF